MFVICQGVVPVLVIQFQGNQIKVGVPAIASAPAARSPQPAPQPWKLPEPSLN